MGIVSGWANVNVKWTVYNAGGSTVYWKAFRSSDGMDTGVASALGAGNTTTLGPYTEYGGGGSVSFTIRWSAEAWPTWVTGEAVDGGTEDIGCNCVVTNSVTVGVSAPSYTNHYACVTLTNGTWMMENFQLTVIYSGGGSTNPFPIQTLSPHEYRDFCWTNSAPFTLVGAGDQEDYFSTPSVPITNTNQVAGGAAGPLLGTTNDPVNQIAGPPTQGQYPTNSDDAARQSANAVVKQLQVQGGQAHSDAVNIQSTINNLRQTLITNTFSLGSDTNSAREQTQRETTNLLGRVSEALGGLDDWVLTNGWAGGSNAVGTSGVSNTWVSGVEALDGGEAGVGALAGGVVSPVAGDEDMWTVRYRRAGDPGDYASWTGVIDCNPLVGRVGNLFLWVNAGIKFLIVFVFFLHMYAVCMEAVNAFQATPGGGRPAAANTPWGGAIWVQGVAAYVAILVGIMVLLVALMGSTLTSIGGWVQYPFSAAGVAIMGDDVPLMRAGLAVVDAIIPVSFLGTCIAAFFVMRMAVHGALVYAKLQVKIHI